MEALSGIVDSTGHKFIAIIDEWDAPVRDSAISEFREYSILDPDGFAPFVRFLEDEVVDWVVRRFSWQSHMIRMIRLNLITV